MTFHPVGPGSIPGNPMTTLGDMIDGAAGGAAARLAGPTSATKQFLTSTGTGSAAQTPAWAAIGNADLPAGSVMLPWVPSDSGLLAANGDTTSLEGTQTLTAGTVYLLKIPIRQALTVSKLYFMMANAGVGTSSGSFCGLYDSTGALLTGSADLVTPFTNSFAPQAVTLTTPQALTAGTFVWAALLANLSVTQPTCQVNFNNGNMANLNLAAAAFRIAVNGTGLTALPSPITPSANSQTGSQNFWIGLS
jgi:hypothetical protein